MDKLTCWQCGRVTIDGVWIRVNIQWTPSCNKRYMCGDCMDIAEQNGKDNIKKAIEIEEKGVRDGM